MCYGARIEGLHEYLVIETRKTLAVVDRKGGSTTCYDMVGHDIKAEPCLRMSNSCGSRIDHYEFIVVNAKDNRVNISIGIPFNFVDVRSCCCLRMFS